MLSFYNEPIQIKSVLVGFQGDFVSKLTIYWFSYLPGSSAQVSRNELTPSGWTWNEYAAKRKIEID